MKETHRKLANRNRKNGKITGMKIDGNVIYPGGNGGEERGDVE